MYLAVVMAMAAGIVLGVVSPNRAMACKPLGDGFVQLVKMLLGPVVFATVALGIGSAGSLKRASRIGLRALLYFEAMTTLALLLGLAVVHIVKPGAGMHLRLADVPKGELAAILLKGGPPAQGVSGHLLALIPETPTAAFARGDALQVLVLALLAGVALASIGDRGAPVKSLLEALLALLFKMMSYIMLLSPFGAFGAMAHTVGKHGIAALLPLAKLMGSFYAAALLFVFVVLGAVCWRCGFSIFRLLRYLKTELLLVLATSSSESALPSLMEKLERMGCAPAVVRLVVPTGYSFNLDGTCIYLTMASVFIAQALDIELRFQDELLLLLLLLLTSKGAAAVTGGGFITLAATLDSTKVLPSAGLGILVGIDRLMSEARALTNLIGNSVATIVVANWEQQLDRVAMTQALGGTQVANEQPAEERPDLHK
jgi:aerobic C4-dicarboxylate transport protein